MKYSNGVFMLFGMLMAFVPAWGMENPLGEPISNKPKTIQRRPSVQKLKSEKKEKIDLTQATVNLGEHLSKNNNEEQIEALNKKEALSKKIEQLNQDKLEKYGSVITPIRLKLRGSGTLKRNVINRIDYSLRMIQEEDVKDIIKEIKEQTLSLKNKLGILRFLRDLPDPALYQKRDEMTIARDKEEQALWLAKKTEVKKVIEELEKEEQQEKEEKLEKISEQFAIERHLDEKIQLAQENVEKEQSLKGLNKEEREKFNEIENQLNMFRQESSSFSLFPLMRMKNLATLNKQYPDNDRINSLLIEYNQELEKVAVPYMNNIIKNKNYNDNKKLEAINRSFPKDNESLVDYRRAALEKLNNHIIEQLNQKNIIKTIPEERFNIINNILLLAKNINYLTDFDKQQFNTLNTNINRLFAEPSYNLLAGIIKNEQEREKFRAAWDIIKKDVKYQEPFGVVTAQPSQPITTSSQTTQALFNQPKLTEQEKEDLEQWRKGQIEEGQKKEAQKKDELIREIQGLEEEVKKLEKELQKESEVSQQQEQRPTGIAAAVWEDVTNFYNAITYPFTFFWSWLWGRQEI